MQKRKRPIIGTNLETGREIHFPYAQAAILEGFTPPIISRCLGGELKSHKGYAWHYADGLPPRQMPPALRAKLLVGPRPKSGSCIATATHFETGEVLTFRYATEAAAHFHVSSHAIHQAFIRKTKIGGVWFIDKPTKPANHPLPKSNEKHEHRKKQKTAILKKNKLRFKLLLEQLKQEMGERCTEPDCERTETLQFAHTDPTTKLFDVADSKNISLRPQRVIDEAKKCRLLCRAHHTIETSQQHKNGSVRGNRDRHIIEASTGVLKPCSSCQQTKDLCEFSPWNGRSKLGRQSACRDCSRDYTNRRVLENRSYVASKRTACIVCGVTEGLDFDHVRGVKFKAVSAMLSYTKKRIDEEIAKCDVVCAVHHAERTARRKEKGPEGPFSNNEDR